LNALKQQIEDFRRDTDAAFRGQVNKNLERTSRDMATILQSPETDFDDPVFALKYGEKLNAFLAHALESSKQNLDTLFAEGRRADRALIERLERSGRLDRIVGQLPHRVGEYGARVGQAVSPGQRVANPIEWARGAELYLQSRQLSPRRAVRRSELSDIRELLDAGRRCRDTIISIGQRPFIRECFEDFEIAANKVSNQLIARIDAWEKSVRKTITTFDAFSAELSMLLRQPLSLKNGLVNYGEAGHQFATNLLNDPVVTALRRGHLEQQDIDREGRGGASDLFFSQKYMDLTLRRGHPQFENLTFNFRVFRGSKGARALVNGEGIPFVPALDTRPWKDVAIERAGGVDAFKALMIPLFEAKRYFADFVQIEQDINDVSFADFIFFNLNYLYSEARTSFVDKLAAEIRDGSTDADLEAILARFEKIGVTLRIAQRLFDWRASRSRAPEHYRIHLNDAIFLRRDLANYVSHRLNLRPTWADAEQMVQDLGIEDNLAQANATARLQNYAKAILPRQLTDRAAAPYLDGPDLPAVQGVPILDDTLIRLEAHLEEVLALQDQ